LAWTRITAGVGMITAVQHTFSGRRFAKLLALCPRVDWFPLDHLLARNASLDASRVWIIFHSIAERFVCALGSIEFRRELDRKRRQLHISSCGRAVAIPRLASGVAMPLDIRVRDAGRICFGARRDTRLQVFAW
jgi:hypothetical protein